MSNFWMIKQIGNGYLVNYPYVYDGIIKNAELFAADFPSALKIVEKNSLLPTLEPKA